MQKLPKLALLKYKGGGDWYANLEQVNEFMLMLIEKSFIVNCEPRYLGAFYEGSVWCGDEHYLRITTKRVEEK